MLEVIRAVVRRSNTRAEQIAQTYAEGSMTASVRIVRGGEGNIGWDSATNALVVPDEQLIWGPELLDDNGNPFPGAGRARVGTVTGPVTMALGDEPQYFQSTFASIPIRAPLPETDDVLTVLTHDDVKLQGRSYRVVDVERGGQIPVVHRMQLVGIQPGRTWRP